MWEWHIGVRSVNHYFVYMKPVTTQLMYNDNKEIIIPKENKRWLTHSGLCVCVCDTHTYIYVCNICV